MGAKNKNVGKPRNYTLASGVYRFGKSATYRKKAIYKFTKKTAKKTEVAKTPIFKEKPIGGAKNGGTRMVRVKKLANDYPTQDKPAAGSSKRFFSGHKRKLRASLQPGAVAILLAGVHKGKRVIVLSQLSSGLLLITGPHKVNGCPLRRVNQRYLLATSTKVDVSGVKIPANIMINILPGLSRRRARMARFSVPRRRSTRPLRRGRRIRPQSTPWFLTP